MTIRMKSLKAHTYAGKRLQAGQEFDARGESDKRVLVAIKAAEVASPVVAAPAPNIEPPKARTYERRDLVAETPVAAVPRAEQPVEQLADAATGQAEEPQLAAEAKPRRTYRRRDATVE